jgi:sec-independent protein translocase protein TatA
MFSDLFDNPWKILIIAIVILVLFGSRKLPAAARSLGQSMRILKTEVQGLREEEEASSAAASTSTAQPAPAQLEPTPSVTAAQAQIDALSQQIASLQQTVTASNVPANNVTDSAQAK